MQLTTQHISVSIVTAQKEALANSSKSLTLVRSCCVESNFCSVRFAQYFSTRLPASGFIGASGNSEWCNMMGNEDNVGFLAIGSGVQQLAFFKGMVCPWSPLLLGVRRLSARLYLLRAFDDRATQTVFNVTISLTDIELDKQPIVLRQQGIEN
jgi:hypothetical protein